MHKENKSMWIAVAATGLVMIMLIVGVVVYISMGRQSSDNPLTGQSENTSEQSTGRQGTPTYSSQDCQPQSGCTAQQNQSQGQGVPPTQGTITAVSDDSISIRPSDGSAVKTFRVTSSTKIMKSTTSSGFKASDLRIGQSVTVAPTLQDSSTVDFIALDNTGRLNDVAE